MSMKHTAPAHEHKEETQGILREIAMALDGIFFSSIVQELQETVLGAKINKVTQPESDMIILHLRGQQGNQKVLLTANSTYARIHLTEQPRENPLQAPLFLMVLRKHLVGSRILGIQQIQGDRLVNLHLLGVDDFGEDQPFVLSVEMMGKHSNIILYRETEGTIVDCIKHVSSLRNTYRTLLPGKEYIAPPASGKLNPLTYSDEELLERTDVSDWDPDFFARHFTGISKKTAHALYEGHPAKPSLSLIRKSLQELTTSTAFYITKKDGEYLDVSALPPTEDHEVYTSPSLALETYVREKDLRDRIRAKTSDLQKILQNNLQRVRKKIELLDKSIVDSQDKDEYRILGEILSANVYALTPGQEKAELLNYYTGEMVTLSLDKSKSISQNIDSYYNRYNKKKRAEIMARGQKILAQEEEDYLVSILLSLDNLENETEIQDIRQELMVAGYLRFKKTASKKEKVSKPLHFKSSEGIDIYVGKNNTQNDYLTTKFAHRTDTWLHTKNIPGSHVIIRGEKFGEDTLLEAANLAAYYSKASASTKVPVDYTTVKNVKKPSGAKPGMVIYSTNKTLYVDPAPSRLERQE
ncbi:Rqc2 family fibronectin-binding protein [Proteiniclasticum sediminis]|nr:NFACT RNA binding domain-containing protein [Proteiniclasticum sediminis]